MVLRQLFVSFAVVCFTFSNIPFAINCYNPVRFLYVKRSLTRAGMLRTEISSHHHTAKGINNCLKTIFWGGENNNMLRTFAQYYIIHVFQKLYLKIWYPCFETITVLVKFTIVCSTVHFWVNHPRWMLKTVVKC